MTGMTTLLLGLCAVIYGLDKSLIPGAGLLAVASLAVVMPAKEATGLTLVMAIVADWTAIWVYRHDVVVRSLLRFLPSVVIGVFVGAVFLFFADDSGTRLTIGVILAVFISIYFISLIVDRLKSKIHAKQDRKPKETGSHLQRKAGGGFPYLSRIWAQSRRVIMGALAGFTTMVANVGGPITSIYFTTEHLPVTKFLGTTAWFYLIVNMIKLPFSIGLGMLTLSNFLSIVWTVPLVIVSVVCGRLLAGRLNQKVFTFIVYLFAVLAVLQLFL